MAERVDPDQQAPKLLKDLSGAAERPSCWHHRRLPHCLPSAAFIHTSLLNTDTTKFCFFTDGEGVYVVVLLLRGNAECLLGYRRVQ